LFIIYRVLEVYLSANIRRLTREGFYALSKLQSLKEFKFFKSRNICKDRQMQLMHMCFEMLPQLHAVSSFIPKPKTFCTDPLIILSESSISALIGLILQYGHYTLKLRHLAVTNHSAYGIPQNLALPELSEVILYGSIREDLMVRFGHQLTALHFFDSSTEVHLDWLLANCPNLTELSLHSYYINNLSELQPHTLQRLQVLHISSEFGAGLDDPNLGLLVDLLQLAPNLRSVSFTLERVYVEIFEGLLLLAKQPFCMRHLEELKFYIKNEPENVFERDLLKSALKSCVIECDQLKTVKVEFKSTSDNEVYSTLVSNCL
jgi:hypothetical protein